MSVLIKGMDKETAVRICAYTGVRMDDSDFVPIPSHGRLIDADKLGIRDAEKQAYEAYLREKGEDFIEEPIIEYHRGYLEGLAHASGLVRFAPTIISAEEATQNDE